MAPQVYESHADIVVASVELGIILRFNNSVTQFTVKPTYVLVPAVVYVTPLFGQVYESQTVIFVVFVVPAGTIVKFNISV